MNIDNFLAENIKSGANEKKVKMERFKDPFVIQSISEFENANLRKASTMRSKKSGTEVNTEMYVDKLVTACVKVPDLNNAKLQESYLTQGDPSGTLKKMLLPGEYADLTTAIQELNGFDQEHEEIVDEVKK